MSTWDLVSLVLLGAFAWLVLSLWVGQALGRRIRRNRIREDIWHEQYRRARQEWREQEKTQGRQPW